MKKIQKIFCIILALMLVCGTSMAASLSMDAVLPEGGDMVTVDIKLDAIPEDIESIAAITIRYTYDKDKLEYMSTAYAKTELANALSNDGNFVWYDETMDASKSITDEKLAESNNILFTVKFRKISGAGGDVNFDFKFVQLSAPAPGFEVSNDIETLGAVINIGEGDSGSDDSGSGDNGSGDSGSGDSGSGDNGSGDGDSGDDSDDDDSDDDSGSSSGGSTVRPGGGSFGGGGGGGFSSGSKNDKKEETKEEVKEEPKEENKTETPKTEFKGFADIPETNWGYKHAKSLMEKGIIAGDGSETPAMRPGDNLTRAEAAKIALLAMGVQPEADLKLECADADSVAAWAVPYIATAMKYGLINGYDDGRVGATDFITREQMLTILARAMKWQVEDGELTFTDAADVQSWAKANIAYAVKLGVVTGYDDGTVRPQANITRLEVFAIVDRCLSAN